jgi:hypothetical protein
MAGQLTHRRAMHRILTMLLAFVLTSRAFATESITLWGCTQGSERRNALYLADRGSGSYVKVGTQRIDARLTVRDGERLWSFGSNHISLKPDGLAEYYEGDTLKGSFRCHQLE